jgi:uncharacterized iron-regulated membrane protein
LQKIKPRKVVAWVHLWTSLLIGAFIIVVTLSGTTLVFYPELNKLIYPHAFTATPGRTSLEQIYHTVQEHYPKRKVEWIVRTVDANSVYQVQLEGEPATTVFVDPGSGQILETLPLDQTLLGWFTKLHTELFLGETGTKILGCIGIALLLMLITGIYLWWPGMKKWLPGWSLRWRRGWYIRNYDVHKLLGVISLPILLVIVLTGISLCFYDQVRPFWYAITFTAQPELRDVKSTKPEGTAKRLTLDQIAARARFFVPDGTVAWINVPADETAPAEIWLSAPFDPYVGSGYDGQVMVQLDQYSGALLQLNDPRTKSWNITLFESWLFALHVGSFGGTAMRILYLVVGLSPTVLAITGLAMWLIKRRNRQRQRRHKPSVVRQQVEQIQEKEQEFDAV